MGNSKVSIVSPIYNGAKWLHYLLDSVLAQNYDNIEMIIVDDGSTDNSVELALSYSERFNERGYSFRVVQEEHKSASGAINEGLKFVTGDYLIWPDSDDVLEPESVSTRVKFLDEHPEYNAVRSTMYYFLDGTGERTKADEKIGDVEKEDLFFDILESKTFVACGCYMLRFKVFLGIYPDRHIPEYPVGQNFQMLLPFMYHNKCKTIAKELYGVNVHEGSHSRTPLTEEQEYAKFRHYENMMRDLIMVAGISDKADLKRIKLWIMRRRKWLANKYGNKIGLLLAHWELVKLGDEKAGRLIVNKINRVIRRFC